jgi:hypothetical protein
MGINEIEEIRVWARNGHRVKEVKENGGKVDSFLEMLEEKESMNSTLIFCSQRRTDICVSDQFLNLINQSIYIFVYS